MVCLKTEEEIKLMREANQLVGKVLAEVAKYIEEGITTLQLEKIAEKFIFDSGAVPLFKGYKGFPGVLCISVNENVVHGIPDSYILKNGDIVSIDCGVKLNGYCGDSAYTFKVGEVDTRIEKLLRTTKKALLIGISNAIEGKRIGDISSSIQKYCESKGYGVVRDLAGHGIGKEMHEAPEIPNFGEQGEGMLLKNGMCISIEPMINLGTRNVKIGKDGWTIYTADRKPSAHFEHTVAVRHGKVDILSTYDFIEMVLSKKNKSDH